MSGVSFITGSANGNTTTNGTTCAAAVGATYSKGDLLVITATDDTSGGDVLIKQVTDTQGNAWLQGAAANNQGVSRHYIYYAIAKAASASNTVTATWNSNVNNDMNIVAYTGFIYVPVLAGASSLFGNSNNASSTIIVPTSLPNVIVAGAGVANSVTGVGGGATNRNTNSFGDNIEDILNAAVGAQSPSAQQTAGNWIFSAVLFVDQPPAGATLLRAKLRPLGI